MARSFVHLRRSFMHRLSTRPFRARTLGFSAALACGGLPLLGCGSAEADSATHATGAADSTQMTLTADETDATPAADVAHVTVAGDDTDSTDVAHVTDEHAADVAHVTDAAAAPAASDGDVLGSTSLAQRWPRPGVRFVGRVDTSDPSVARFAWSGTGVVARFTGNYVGVTLGGTQQYTVVIDGVAQPKLVSSGGHHVLATGLPWREHRVEIYRRLEAAQGESEFHGFDFGAGRLLSPPRAAQRRIEIIGDSNSCGYGNEGAGPSCPFTPDTENHYLSYGAIAARSLGAELSTLCWSGKGVVCNYGDGPESCIDPLPVFLDRTLPERADSSWDHSRAQPHAVVINLGANDISTSIDPTQAELEAGYVQLLERTRERYPAALVLATLGPMRPERAFLREYLQGAVQLRVEAGDSNVMWVDLPETDPLNGFGCDGHPSLRTHEILAEELARVLESELGW